MILKSSLIIVGTSPWKLLSKTGKRKAALEANILRLIEIQNYLTFSICKWDSIVLIEWLLHIWSKIEAPPPIVCCIVTWKLRKKLWGNCKSEEINNGISIRKSNLIQKV